MPGVSGRFTTAIKEVFKLNLKRGGILSGLTARREPGSGRSQGIQIL